MMIRLLSFVLLLALVGACAANDEQSLRGAAHSEDRKLNNNHSERSKAMGEENDPFVSTGIQSRSSTGGYCLCNTLCQACSSFSADMPDCQVTCSLVGLPDCQDQCMNWIRNGVVPGAGDIRDDPVTQPPLPTEATPVAPCRCIALCDSCRANNSNTASCQTVCEFAEDPQCTPKCNTALNLSN